MVQEVNLCSRSVYCIIYSYDDTAKVSSRNFSEIVINTFNRNGIVRLSRWIFSKEKHKNSGSYDHITVTLDRQKG